MRFTSKAELLEVTKYEQRRWFEANGLDINSKSQKSRETDYVTSLRYVEYYHQFPKWQRLVRGGGVIFVYHRLRYNYLCKKNNVWIMPGCFDKGLVIRHLQNIVASAGVRAGENCTILHNVTIGVNFARPGVPHIGNNVLLCCGAGIYGDIEIADGVTIGANAVVITSCTHSDAVYAGVPAKLIKENERRNKPN